ncbi:GNAT family N-acetyltransferase [Actinoplanes sp. NPDC049681]|uniref:GNAT family N-acetyltransferase n=1 Tax=Actinoplanes sp. NPDC049681 TaxID=3363905 RepID=UPI00379DE852
MTIETRMLPPEQASDTRLLAELTAMTNQAYAEGEKGLWSDGTARITSPEMAELIASGQIAVGRLDGEPVGLVRVQQLNPTLGELGLLVAAAEHKGTGVGRELVRFAESRATGWGAQTMQLELLVPEVGTHPVKEFLRAWYTRRGYRVVGSGDVAEAHPALAPLLAVPCRFLVFHKELERP